MQIHDESDRRWLEAVQPERWENPRPAERYNLLVVGGGPAGLLAARVAAGLGGRVALVEKARLGGDCLNYGCVPSKTLLRSARAAAAARGAPALGVHAGAMHVDFGAVMARVRAVRAELSGGDAAARFARLGVDVYFGDGRFTGPDTFLVDGRHLRFHRACIATGSSPVLPPIPGLRGAEPLTNETVFDLERLPPRLVVIGGGPVGCELAQAFARLGSAVNLLEAGPRLLPHDDPAAVELVARALARDGVAIRPRSQVHAVRVVDGEKVLVTADGGTVLADAVLVAAGRRPNVVGLSLESAGVDYDDDGGVRVDDHLRTTNHRIYAAGDVCTSMRFTHAADAHARIVVRNALFFGRRKVSALHVPWCIFTEPELAHVGPQPQALLERGVSVHTLRVPLSATDRAETDDHEGLLQVHLKRGTDQILGGTWVGPNAGEQIGLLVLALQERIGLSAFSDVVLPYPTEAEALRRAADHWQRGRLGPRLRKATGWLMEARR